MAAVRFDDLIIKSNSFRPDRKSWGGLFVAIVFSRTVAIIGLAVLSPFLTHFDALGDEARRQPIGNQSSSASQPTGGPFAAGSLVDEEHGNSDRESRENAIAALPLRKLTPNAVRQIAQIVDKPSVYRRLPIQTIAADRDLFLFLTRQPEVLVGMWDLMGITNVQIRRTGQYQLQASDGSGTHCTMDLVYGDPDIHVFVAHGMYDGKLVARPVKGNGVFVVRSQYATDPNGTHIVAGTLDCFLQMENLAADLIARTFGGLIGRSADHNFRETAGFVEQVSTASELNPAAMLDVASRLPQVDEEVRDRFAKVIRDVAIRTIR